MPLTLQSETLVKCPVCNSDAIYKYGRTKIGKQRFRCLICGRQFSYGTKRRELQEKPICPECGKSMHIYKIEGEAIRFRCAGYPVCKTFIKIQIKKED